MASSTAPTKKKHIKISRPSGDASAALGGAGRGGATCSWRWEQMEIGNIKTSDGNWNLLGNFGWIPRFGMCLSK